MCAPPPPPSFPGGFGQGGAVEERVGTSCYLIMVYPLDSVPN